MRRTSNSSTADLHVKHQPVLSIASVSSSEGVMPHWVIVNFRQSLSSGCSTAERTNVYLLLLTYCDRVGSTLCSTGWGRFDQRRIRRHLTTSTTRISFADSDTGCTRTGSTEHASVTRSMSRRDGADCRLPLTPTYRSLRHRPENIRSIHISSVVSMWINILPGGEGARQRRQLKILGA